MLKWQVFVFVFYELLETLEIDSIMVIFKGMIKTTITNICWTLSVLDTAPKHVSCVLFSLILRVFPSWMFYFNAHFIGNKGTEWLDNLSNVILVEAAL